MPLQHLLYSKAAVKITIISDNKARPPLRNTEYADFLNENPRRSIDFITTAKKSHDRYIILDYNTKDMTGYGDMIKDLLSNPPLVLK